MSRKEINSIADEGDEDHDGSLLPFRLIDNDQAQGESRHEYESIERWERGRASCSRRCVFVDEAVDCGTYRDSEAEEK